MSAKQKLHKRDVGKSGSNLDSYMSVIDGQVFVNGVDLGPVENVQKALELLERADYDTTRSVYDVKSFPAAGEITVASVSEPVAGVLVTHGQINARIRQTSDSFWLKNIRLGGKGGPSWYE